MTEIFDGKGHKPERVEEEGSSVEAQMQGLENGLAAALKTIRESSPDDIREGKRDEALKKALLSVLAVAYTRASVRQVDKGATSTPHWVATKAGPVVRGARASFVAGGFIASLPAVVPAVQAIFQYVPRKLGLPAADTPMEFAATLGILGAAAATVLWETVSPGRRRAEEKKEAAAVLEEILGDESKMAEIRKSAAEGGTDSLLQACGELVADIAPRSSARNAPTLSARRGGVLAALVAAAIGSGILTHATVKATTGAATEQVARRIIMPGRAKGDPVEMFVESAWKRFSPGTSAQEITGTIRRGFGMVPENTPPAKQK